MDDLHGQMDRVSKPNRTGTERRELGEDFLIGSTEPLAAKKREGPHELSHKDKRQATAGIAAQAKAKAKGKDKQKGQKKVRRNSDICRLYETEGWRETNDLRAQARVARQRARWISNLAGRLEDVVALGSSLAALPTEVDVFLGAAKRFLPNPFEPHDDRTGYELARAAARRAKADSERLRRQATAARRRAERLSGALPTEEPAEGMEVDRSEIFAAEAEEESSRGRANTLAEEARWLESTAESLASEEGPGEAGVLSLSGPDALRLIQAAKRYHLESSGPRDYGAGVVVAQAAAKGAWAEASRAFGSYISAAGGSWRSKQARESSSQATAFAHGAMAVLESIHAWQGLVEAYPSYLERAQEEAVIGPFVGRLGLSHRGALEPGLFEAWRDLMAAVTLWKVDAEAIALRALVRTIRSEHFLAGLSARELSRKHEVSRHQINRILLSFGMPLRKSRPGPKAGEVPWRQRAEEARRAKRRGALALPSDPHMTCLSVPPNLLAARPPHAALVA